MTTAQIVDINVNPANTDQRYILWSNGRVDNIGGAPAITSSPNWFNRIDQPVGAALHITNWTTGAGYILDYTGKFNPINGAAVLGTGGYLTGVPQAATRTYIDWAWNTNGSTQGYVLDLYGQLYPFGGAAAPPRSGRRWGHPIGRRLRCQFSPDIRVYTLDQYGGCWPDHNAVSISQITTWPGWDAARDFVITDWTNGKGYVLDLYGGHNPFGGAISISGFPYKRGSDCGRRHYLLDPVALIFWVVWELGQQYEYHNPPAPPNVVAGGGTNEQQTVTITGVPTGGTFTLTLGAATTSAIAFNATAATVQTAVQALSTVGSGNATVTGGQGLTNTLWTVTFGGTLSSSNVAQMTATSSLTGGTSPTITVATTIAGQTPLSPSATVTTTMRPTLAWSYSDPANSAQNQWQLYVYTQTFAGAHSMTDPSVWASSAIGYQTGTDPARRGVVLPTDLVNDNYVFFVRAQSTSGLWSAWSSYSWTQTFPPPAAPTSPTAVPDNTNFRVTLSALNNLTGNLATWTIFEYSEDSGVTWNAVRGAEQLPIAATNTAIDADIPLGTTRSYRARVYSSNPRWISSWSGTVSATVTNRKYVLTSTADPTLGGEVFVVDTPTWTRPAKPGVFTGVGAEYPVVVSDGIPKARTQTIKVECDGAAQWALVQALVTSDSTLVLRDPFGDVMYCRLAGDFSRQQQWKRPYSTESTPLRHNHVVTIPLQEVQPPLLLDLGNTLPPGPTIATSS